MHLLDNDMLAKSKRSFLKVRFFNMAKDENFQEDQDKTTDFTSL